MSDTSTVTQRRPSGAAFLPAFAAALAIAAVARAPRWDRLQPASRSQEGGNTSSRNPQAAAQERGRGRTADQPTEIPASGWWDILKRVVDQISEDRILAVAAGVTFFALLALFPAIAALVSLYGLFSDASTINDHLATLGGFLPGGALDIVTDQVKRITSKGNSTLGFAFFSGLAVSLWSANAGMKAVFDALNVAYDEKEKRNFVFLNLWSLAFTVASVLFLIIALSAVVVIPVILKYIGLGEVTDWIVWVGRWPALLLITFLALAVLYRYGASRDRARWSWLAPGTLLAGLGWMAFSMLFSWYVSSFGNYNETYGSLGAAIGFMTWMWLSATILLVGAELNAETEHQTARDTTEGTPQPLGTRGATMADTIGRS